MNMQVLDARRDVGGGYTLLSAEPDGAAALAVALTWLSASPWPRAILPDHIKIGSYADYESPADPALAWGLTGLNGLANRGVQNSYWQAMSEALVERIVTDPRSDVPSDLRDIIYRATVFTGTKLHLGGVITLDDLARVICPLIQPTTGFLVIVGSILVADGKDLISKLTQHAGCERFIEAVSQALVTTQRDSGSQIDPEILALIQTLSLDL